MKNILGFNQFQNKEKLNEEVLGKLFSKLKTWIESKATNLKGWSKEFYQNLLNGKIRIGKNGKPVAMLYDPANGSILEQLRSSQAMNESYVIEARVPLEYSEEDQSVRDVSSEELIDLIDNLYDEKLHGAPAVPLFIFGAPGIGKTEIVAQAADYLGISLLNLDAQNMAMEDFMGVPKVIDIEEPEFEEDGEGRKRMKSAGKGLTRFNPPNLPRDNGSNGKGGILFLDELNKADDYLLRKLNQFIQKGRLNEYLLPNKWIIVAAGNRPSDKVDIAQMDTSFVQRFRIVNYVPEIGVDDKGEIVGGWAKYAMKTGQVLPELIYFLASEKELFHYLDSEKAVGIYPTPRSWTLGAQSLYRTLQKKGLKSWRELGIRDLQNIFHDSVGTTAAAKFADFLNVLRELTETDMRQVLTDSSKAKISEKFKRQKRFLYVIGHNLLKMVPENMSDLKSRDEQVYNIINYLARYEQFEILTWILARVKERYPEWAQTGAGDNASIPGFEWRKKGWEIMITARKKSGI